MAVNCMEIHGSVQFQVMFQKAVDVCVHSATQEPSTLLAQRVWLILTVGGATRVPIVWKVTRAVHTASMTARKTTGHTIVVVNIVMINFRTDSQQYKVENALVYRNCWSINCTMYFACK